MSMSDKNTIIEDFEKLLELAEESSKKIDILLQVREKQKMRSIFSILVVYAFAVFTYFFTKYVFVGSYFMSSYKEAYAMVLLISVGFVSFWIIYKNYFFVRKIIRELRIERNIHETLISMLDDQKQRLYHSEQISSVAFAIYEIRMQRLDRTDKKIY
ncbi:hypothetical protein [Enterobacter bugandensis]|uniref:hypothetical protein n=1 Tax=Enterobacter bugandensis TaxID=881260 RepID=UPI00300CDD2E